MPRRIGVLTGGGDCPGLNAVIRAVTKTAIVQYGMEVIGIRDGYQGLVEANGEPLASDAVSNILTVGGTILGTSNRANPFRYAQEVADGEFVFKDRSQDCVENYSNWELDGLVCIGGDGTLSIAKQLMEKGLNVCGVPKTIDNDLSCTDVTFGFDTAVQVVSDAIDRLHTTAQSHHRVMIVETMGRYAGWLALKGGLSGGGDIILIPEISYTTENVCDAVRKRGARGKRCSIVVVAEGAKPKGGKLTVAKMDKAKHDQVRLGGIAVKLADEIEESTNLECRAAVLGHLQRGGTPTAFDRVLATQFGAVALDLVAKRQFGKMVALKGNKVVAAPLQSAVARLKLVDPDGPLVLTARKIGTSFGD